MQPHLLMRRIDTLRQRLIMQSLAGLGMSLGQPKILECLANLGESDQKTIARYCAIEPATCSALLRRMEEAGLVDRSRHEGNHRSVFISLTPTGRELAVRVKQAVDEVEDDMMRGMSPSDRERFVDLLEQGFDNLNDAAEARTRKDDGDPIE